MCSVAFPLALHFWIARSCCICSSIYRSKSWTFLAIDQFDYDNEWVVRSLFYCFQFSTLHLWNIVDLISCTFNISSMVWVSIEFIYWTWIWPLDVTIEHCAIYAYFVSSDCSHCKDKLKMLSCLALMWDVGAFPGIWSHLEERIAPSESMRLNALTHKSSKYN